MSILALVDCNNFYVSCHRVFNPILEDKPVVVLSNNDGCVISRSNQAKQLNIPMGAPYHKFRALCSHHNVAVFSSNYALYGDMSHRVMVALQQFCPDMEIYSIDEAFLSLNHLPHLNLLDYCHQMRQKIKMWTGIPVSIGIASTKTLAKAANHMAKKNNLGVFDLRDTQQQKEVLNNFAVKDIWGIGFQLDKKLAGLGIYTAQQLRQSQPKIIRQYFGVTVERTLLELLDISCIGLESSKPRKNIISSRSFGKPISQLTEIEEAISGYVATACVKLRRQQSKAQGIYVFLQTNPFNPKQKFYTGNAVGRFAHSSDDTRFIIQAAKDAVKKIFLPNRNYHKAGIILTDITANAVNQFDLFTAEQEQKTTELMQLVDNINNKMGKNTIFIAAQGTKRKWEMRANQQTPKSTTRWEDLPLVVCK